ncbi:predicted protein [Chaetomium globosum CBS 148.51]|uniref:Uncharacterized protein n=1 Tax=Chaetomium globosum (strain ATCC 6205 / CBS 148.51 / DSM 1962 / NBRC 6347 / NRRL 1970) TaxID=306901 RepID=Q2H1H5_CHAGB|nr:uncharacterized protein CHGG_04371 [Chaetomium globosum CBS 148.51]EAQ87752.1 predicted protein [Chaetomium globosum CBS 148.51]
MVTTVKKQPNDGVIWHNPLLSGPSMEQTRVRGPRVDRDDVRTLFSEDVGVGKELAHWQTECRDSVRRFLVGGEKTRVEASLQLNPAYMYLANTWAERSKLTASPAPWCESRPRLW